MAVKCNNNPYADGPVFEISTPDPVINDICNTFISSTNIDVTTPTGFTTLLRYISQHIDKIDNSDIDTMDYYFNIYTYIASQCKMLPDISAFCLMIDLSIDTLNDWAEGKTRSNTHSHIVKKWNTFCKSTCVSSAATGNVGAIYVSKALYGLSDQLRPTYQQNNIYIDAPVSREAIAAEFGSLLPDKSDIIDVPDNI